MGKRKKKQKHFLFVLAFMTVLTVIPHSISSAEIFTMFGEMFSTVDGQNYWNWIDLASSYLVAEEDGYLRVSIYSFATRNELDERLEAVDKLVIEKYNADFEVKSIQYVTPELPVFGGFYSNADFYYMVYGQENEEESDDVEVIRVVKYDKNWNRISSASVYGANTKVPFKAGNLQITECGEYLYLHTAHTMYKSKKDGMNHQANMTIRIYEPDMEVLTTSAARYVSHAFNQLILVDDKDNLVTLDQGDGHPRSAVLVKYHDRADGEKFNRNNSSSINLLNYQGAVGANVTKATVGGLVYSDTHYLTAGSSIIQDEDYKNRETQNIYLTVTKKDSFSKDNTTFTWITDYDEEDKVIASAPVLVKRNDHSFLLMWSLVDESSDIMNKNFYYVFLDGEGKINGPVYRKEGYLSDCQPIVNKDGDVIWHTLQDGNIIFYQIKEDGSLFSKSATPKLTSVQNVRKGVELKWESVPGASKYRIYRLHREVDQYNILSERGNLKRSPLCDTIDSSTSFLDTTVSKGEVYTYTIQALDADDNVMHAGFDWTGKTIKYTLSSKKPNSNLIPADEFDRVSLDVLDTEDTEVQEKLKIISVKTKTKGSKLLKVSGKVSVKDATVEVEVIGQKFKKARVTGKKFTFKVSPKVNKYVTFRVRVSKPGCKTITRIY